MHLLHVVALIWFMFSNEQRWTMMDQLPIHIAPSKATPCRNPETNWEKNLLPLKSWGILLLLSLKPGFHLIYLFKEEWSLLTTIYLFCPSATAVGDLKHSCSVSGRAVAVYLLLFLAQLSVLSERCASLPRCKWPFDELVKDLNYPRTWEKAF